MSAVFPRSQVGQDTVKPDPARQNSWGLARPESASLAMPKPGLTYIAYAIQHILGRPPLR